MMLAQCVFLLLLHVFFIQMLRGRKIREEIATASSALPPASTQNKRLRWLVATAPLVFFMGWRILPYVTNLDDYLVKKNGHFPRSTIATQNGLYIKANQSLIVCNTNHVQYTSRGAIGHRCLITINGYPEFQIKEHTKYTLENGVIREEPWDDPDGWWE